MLTSALTYFNKKYLERYEIFIAINFNVNEISYSARIQTRIYIVKDFALTSALTYFNKEYLERDKIFIAVNFNVNEIMEGSPQ